MVNANKGHGHVYPRPDGSKARCGGPALCSECGAELAAKLLSEAGNTNNNNRVPDFLCRTSQDNLGKAVLAATFFNDMWRTFQSRHVVIPPFMEFETRPTPNKVAIAVYVHTDFLMQSDYRATERWFLPPLAALAKRVRDLGFVPDTEHEGFELPRGVMFAHNVRAPDGPMVRTIMQFYPSSSREFGMDYGAALLPYYNMDLEVMEQRWCVLVARFDVPVRPLS